MGKLIVAIIVSVLLSILYESQVSAAQTFKCKDEKGVTVYSDRRCEADTPTVRLVDSSFDRQPNRLSYKPSLDPALEAQRQQRIRNNVLAQGVLEKRILPGMTEEEVKLAVGEPTEIVQDGSAVRWIYRETGAVKKTSTFYFAGGRVKSVP